MTLNRLMHISEPVDRFWSRLNETNSRRQLQAERAGAVRRANMRQFWRRIRPACTLCRGTGRLERLSGNWTCWRCRGSGRRWFWEL